MKYDYYIKFFHAHKLLIFFHLNNIVSIYDLSS